MKKMVSLIIILCLLVSSMPFAALAVSNSVRYAASNSADVTDAEVLENFLKDASAYIMDAEGNIIEELDVEVSVTRDTVPQRDTGTTYTVTYTARASKVDSGMYDHPDGVSASGSISWNDILGTTNSLVNVYGYWDVADETISNRRVVYGARNTDNITTVTLTKYPSGNTFGYSPTNCTGFVFYLYTYATIDATGNQIFLAVTTSMFT